MATFTVEQFSRMTELTAKSQDGGLSAEEVTELADLYTAQDAAQNDARRVLRASGVKFPDETDDKRLTDIVATAHFLWLLERMYTRVKLANATNTYNDIAAKYGYTFCNDPLSLLKHLEAHLPSSVFARGKEKYRVGQGAKYSDWKRGIAGLAAVEGAIKAGRVHKAAADTE